MTAFTYQGMEERNRVPWRGLFPGVPAITQAKWLYRPTFRIGTKPGDRIQIEKSGRTHLIRAGDGPDG